MASITHSGYSSILTDASLPGGGTTAKATIDGTNGERCRLQLTASFPTAAQLGLTVKVYAADSVGKVREITSFTSNTVPEQTGLISHSNPIPICENALYAYIINDDPANAATDIDLGVSITTVA